MLRPKDSANTMADFDLAIIGGGINGAGIARDAAGRGIRVLLIEQNDLASGTSSASTKLIHGGLRYLEQWAFRLVRADRAAEVWQLVLNVNGRREAVTARVLVNAAGPWVAHVMTSMLRLKTAAHVRLVKGSHIVVPKLFDHDRAYLFQSADS